MANEEHLKILEQGVQVWNQWRKENPNIQPDLSHIDLSYTVLNRADFNNTNLSWTNLRKVDLYWANLSKANLSYSSLNKAHLYRSNLQNAQLNLAYLEGALFANVNLRGADLEEANLRVAYFNRTSLNGAELHGARFIHSYLGETNLNKAKLFDTIFADVDLSTTKGLDKVVHEGPSHIDINTIYRSGGNIPEIFLRNAGLPETFITYAASLVGQPIQYYSCFISYSNKDKGFAERLHADLQQKGVRCWFAPEDMKIGDKIRHRIDESIRIHDKLLLILSKHSINSTWLESEVEAAREEERKRNQTVLFPVRLDEAVMETKQAWAADIRRTRHIGDFSRWKDHDAYQQAFERLLRDLKAEG